MVLGAFSDERRGKLNRQEKTEDVCERIVQCGILNVSLETALRKESEVLLFRHQKPTGRGQEAVWKKGRGLDDAPPERQRLLRKPAEKPEAVAAFPSKVESQECDLVLKREMTG